MVSVNLTLSNSNKISLPAPLKITNMLFSSIRKAKNYSFTAEKVLKKNRISLAGVFCWNGFVQNKTDKVLHDRL